MYFILTSGYLTGESRDNTTLPYLWIFKQSWKKSGSATLPYLTPPNRKDEHVWLYSKNCENLKHEYILIFLTKNSKFIWSDSFLKWISGRSPVGIYKMCFQRLDRISVTSAKCVKETTWRNVRRYHSVLCYRSRITGV